jgi:hypothetical protein
MLEDALIDLTNRGDIVVDPFSAPARPLLPLTRLAAFAEA